MSQALLKQLRESQELPDKLGSGNSTTHCYKVQARACEGCGPKAIRGAEVGSFASSVLTDSKWETLHFPSAPIGVPASPFNDEYARHGYYSYAAAQALRWWFIAEQRGFSGIETRLLECKFEYSYKASAVRAICVIDPEQREDILPDWGKKEASND